MSEKPYNSKQLDEIRQRIDGLDNRIHDMLMERAALVLQIGEEKRRNNIQIVQPAREARMIRRLLARHQGALPEMAVVRIWRELVGAVSLLQTGLKVAVAMPEGDHDYWDLARDYFGSCLPMQKIASPLAAIGAVREDKASFAVVPWPETESDQPWWAFLAEDAREPMRIIIRLPHGDDPASLNPDNRALVVSKAGFDESGADRSFLLVHCDATVSRAKLADTAQKMNLEPRSISSRRTAGGAQPYQHLVEVDGYIGLNDPRLKAFGEKLEDPAARVICAGGYPVPPVYSKNVTPAQEAFPAAPRESEKKPQGQATA